MLNNSIRKLRGNLNNGIDQVEDKISGLGDKSEELDH